MKCLRVVLLATALSGAPGVDDAIAQHYARRPVVGLALGGGSAKGFAHVGVLRWFEEHRIPIDRIAGTSMGGLIGGAYAAGMSAGDLDSLLVHTNWNDVFGASTYSYKSIARKQDARAYPSWLEFHLRNGVSLPPALNRGQQVELIIHQIAGLNGNVRTFDDLPTPFRTTAVDLRTGALIVLQDGSLPMAMRATMSIPGVFPPVHVRNWVLVDGGAMNNLPADVVRSMGANVVIAVKVGASADTAVVASGLFGIANQTVSAMMRANTRRAMKHADIVVQAAEEFGGSDWRSVRQLIDDGYAAAEALKPQLIKYAVDEATWRNYLAERALRRRTGLPMIGRVEVRGATSLDEAVIRRRLAGHVNRPLDIARLHGDIARLGGLDRYTSYGWHVDNVAGVPTLVITTQPLPNAPPFLMMSVNVRNPSSDEYLFQLAFRYLSYDMLARGTEFRFDLGLGADPHAAVELRYPFGRSPFFTALSAAAQRSRANIFLDDEPVAQYRETRVFGQLDVGVTPNYDTELRLGVRGGYYDGDIRIGDPGFPDLSGGFWEARFRSILDKQNSAMVPSKGLRLVSAARYVLAWPDAGDESDRTNDDLMQLEVGASHFWSWRNASRRVFVLAGGGTSFDKDPLPTDQFSLGVPMRLDAFAEGERRGDHYAVLTAGFLNEVARLPDFLGGPVLGGVWLENGSAFNDPDRAQYEFQVSAGVVAETLVGPAWIGYSIGPSARGLFAGIGRLFH
jgi:NTE family protein